MKLVIIGASGHGKEVAEVLVEQSRVGHPLGEVEGFLDDDPELCGTSVAGIPVLGGTSMITGFGQPLGVLLGLGYPESKVRVLRRLGPNSFTWPTAVHPSASVGRTVNIAHGSLVQANVVLSANVRIDEFVTVNLGATVSHDCVVRRFATLSPGVNVGGNVEIGEGAFVGIGASVLQGIHVGGWSVIGAGAVVIEDVAPNAVVAGVPARMIRSREQGWQNE